MGVGKVWGGWYWAGGGAEQVYVDVGPEVACTIMWLDMEVLNPVLVK